MTPNHALTCTYNSLYTLSVFLRGTYYFDHLVIMYAPRQPKSQSRSFSNVASRFPLFRLQKLNSGNERTCMLTDWSVLLRWKSIENRIIHIRSVNLRVTGCFLFPSMPSAPICMITDRRGQINSLINAIDAKITAHGAQRFNYSINPSFIQAAGATRHPIRSLVAGASVIKTGEKASHINSSASLNVTR